MTSWSDLQACAALLETTLRQSPKVNSPQFDDHRREVIQMRRLMAAQLRALATAGAELDDAGLQSAFRSEFSAMRAALALHQAMWPVVAIDLNDSAYAASVATTRAANERFFEWVRCVRPAPS